jgi:hypothetical protein
MRTAVVFDGHGRNIFTPEQMSQHGFPYYSMGRGDQSRSDAEHHHAYDFNPLNQDVHAFTYDVPPRCWASPRTAPCRLGLQTARADQRRELDGDEAFRLNTAAQLSTCRWPAVV